MGESPLAGGASTRSASASAAAPPTRSTPPRPGVSVSQLAAKTVLWAGGVITTQFGKKLAEPTHAETDRGGRIKVNPDLTVMRYPDIFVAGDLALSLGKNQRPLPGVAQVAIQGGNNGRSH